MSSSKETKADSTWNLKIFFPGTILNTIYIGAFFEMTCVKKASNNFLLFKIQF